MIEVVMTYGGHHWKKQNLTTERDRKGMFDEYKCSCCGIKGKSYTFGFIEVSGRYKAEKLRKCKGVMKSTKIRIIHCSAHGSQFTNLKDGSIHTIIAPPEGYDNKRGEWVMGLDEPVLVLNNEFTYIKPLYKNKKKRI